MRFNNFLEGLKTLAPYYSDSDGFHISAEHDQFYAYSTDTPLTPEDVKKMVDLGWFQPEEGISVDTDVPYDPQEAWSAFT